MIVCHCFGVTDREIRASVAQGATSCAAVAECCGAGSGCGGCQPTVAEIVHSDHRRLSLLPSDGPSALACLVALAGPSPA